MAASTVFRRGDFADFHQRFSLVPRRCAGSEGLRDKLVVYLASHHPREPLVDEAANATSRSATSDATASGLRMNTTVSARAIVS